MVPTNDDVSVEVPGPCGARTKREGVESGLQRLDRVGEQARSRRSRYRLRWQGEVVVIRIG